MVIICEPRQDARSLFHEVLLVTFSFSLSPFSRSFSSLFLLFCIEVEIIIRSLRAGIIPAASNSPLVLPHLSLGAR